MRAQSYSKYSKAVSYRSKRLVVLFPNVHKYRRPKLDHLSSMLNQFFLK